MATARDAAGVRARRPAGRATDREVGVVAAVLDAGSEKAAAHRLGLSHSTVKHPLANARSKVGAATTAQLVWILAERLPEPEGGVQTDELAVCPPSVVGDAPDRCRPALENVPDRDRAASRVPHDSGTFGQVVPAALF